MTKSKPAPNEDLLDAAEARKLLGISQATFYRWLKDGRLKGTKLGGRWRFHPEALEEILRCTEGVAEFADALKEAESLWAERLKRTGIGRKQIEKLRTDRLEHDSASVLAQMLLEHAVARGAVNLDVVPVAEGLEIRERVDSVFGPLEPLLPAACHRPLVAALKNLIGVSPVTEAAQDDRFDITVDGRRIEVRLVSYPTSRGESLSLRLLDPQSINLDLGKLGLKGGVERSVRGALAPSAGVLLVNGPTDAGKTTTLYCLIETKKMPHLKVMTVEDPVELRLDGVLQAEASEKFDFETAMRAMVRSNVDVGMVSELRTPEAIGLLFAMARTGHLMLSTLHARDGAAAIDTILRIGGVEPRLICDNLLGVLTQRLLPRLCTDCRKECKVRRDHVQLLGLKGIDRSRTVFTSRGCKNCHGTGVRGRVLATEWLSLTPQLQAVVLSDDPRPESLRTALPANFHDLKDDVLAKLWAGQVDSGAAVAALV